MEPLERIRLATAERHRHLESLPYAQAALDGSLPLANYASFLRAVDLVHAELEQAIELSGQAGLRAAFGHAFERRERLAQDLKFLRSDPGLVDAAALQALVLGQVMRLGARRDPAQLLGHAYVLEGSQLGGLVQAVALEKRPELREGGVRYLTGAGASAQSEFRAFVVRLEAALAQDAPRAQAAEAAVQAAIEGALAAFAGFERILAAVDPTKQRDSWLAVELNPEAGTHALPNELREIAAALDAGERSYRAVAYYEARYGERGLRFTRSDSAWLVTLAAEQDQAETVRHVQWLARVLAARGMPSVLLERHLGLLHDALVAALPERAASYRALRHAATQLKAQRYAALPRFDVLCEAQPTALANEQTISAREAIMLLVGAVGDERRGVAKAVPSLTSWLCDPALFSAAWRSAATQVLHEARAEPPPEAGS